MSEYDFQQAVLASEGVRQSDIAAAKLLSEAEVAAAVEAADRGHFNRIVAAGARTEMRAPNTEAAVTEHPRQQESVTATDDTLFLLDGGCYDCSATATFAEGGTVKLVAAGNDVIASFTENGSAEIEVRYGEYRLVIASASDVTVTVTTCEYE